LRRNAVALNFDPPLTAVAAAFPHMQILGRLGSGGQHTVYKVLTGDTKTAALKLAPRGSLTSSMRADREKVAGQKVAGQHFASLYDTGEATVSGHPCDYLVEEFIEGESLRSRLQRGPLPLEDVRRVGDSLLAALADVESAKLVHRDIKPDNIMLQPDSRVVLIDFGIARHLDETSITADLALHGPLSLGYCAPEQVKNRKHSISIKTDLFAVGVVLYEMTTGSNPFLANASPDQALQRCLTLNPPSLQSLGFSRSLSSYVSMCLEKSPSRRPATLARARASFDKIEWSRP
jgi:serine/threonine protein kinase